MKTITFEWRGVLDCWIGKDGTRGRRWLDGRFIPYGAELWAGRRHVILEPFLFLKPRRRQTVPAGLPEDRMAA